MKDWSGVAQAYRTSFATLCAGAGDEILDEVRGRRLLDVGCGTGSLLQRARRRGLDAHGVDADPAMVALAREAGPVTRAALPRLPFGDGSFDSVTASFVVNHVPDPRAAMRELARVAHDRVVVTIWRGGSGWTALIGEAFDDAGVVPLASRHLPPELDFERSVRGLSGLAAQAGLDVVVAREIEWVWRIAPDDLWAGVTGGIATPGETYLAQESRVRERADAAFRARAAAQAVDGVLALPVRAALVTAATRAADVRAGGSPAGSR